MVTRLALGGYPFAGINRAQGWDPYTPEGEREALRTIHAALDGGINYIDTAPGYGAGHSESLIGQVMRTRRNECYLATKVAFDGDRFSTIHSCEESLRRLQTDYLDVLQFHGGRFTPTQIDHILNGGPMEAMEELKQKGLISHIGFTVEEPWTALALIASGRFEMVQVCYNLARQAAGYHLLDDAIKADMGVCCMRPLTSGILQRQLETLAPQWLENGEINRVLMAFLLSDSRVHMIPVGMRWEREVRENIAFVESFVPAADMASMPRMTQHVYETDDARHAREAAET
jgi:aryl-alcohol dehydrogenase-like predicted oxidoreductase